MRSKGLKHVEGYTHTPPSRTNYGMSRLENFIDKEPDLLQDAVKFDDLDECLVGYANQCTRPPLLVYSYDLIVEHFIKDGCTYDEACEYIDYNIECLWCGEGSPIILYT